MLWIGGVPATGKSTVARTLARRYGLRLYAADTRTWVHRDRSCGRADLIVPGAPGAEHDRERSLVVVAGQPGRMAR